MRRPATRAPTAQPMSRRWRERAAVSISNIAGRTIRMNRRQLLFGLAPLLGSSNIAAIAEDSAAAWIQTLYRTEIARRPGEPVSQESFLSAFTPSLREIWLAARKGPGPKMEGPILNAYFGWGVLPGHSIEITRVATLSEDASSGRVALELRVNGRARRVIVETRRISGAWRIDDIVYDQGESFRAHQLKCVAEPC